MREDCNIIEELFKKNDKRIVIDVSKKQETLERITNECSSKYSDSGVRSKWQLLKYQVYYMDKTVLIVHLLACMGTIFWGRCQQWEQISMIVSGALGALSLLEVENMFCLRMTELAESCYFNARQLAAFQMTYSGLISLAALLITTILTSLQYELDIIEMGVYILVPFVFTECICMTALLMEIGRRNLLLIVVVGVFSALFWAVLASIPALYEASALIFWGIALLVGIGVLAIQLRRFFSVMDKGEILCVD